VVIHRIGILPRHDDRRYGQEPIAYQGKEIGKSKEPILTAARWLLDNGAAFPEDTIETYRNGKLSLSGVVGKLAKLTVRENDHGMQLVRWMPFSHNSVFSRTGKNDQPATTIADD